MRRLPAAFAGPAALVAVLGLLAVPAGAYFEDHAQGARPAGLGEAFTAVADDAHAALFNPAGLAGLDRVELTGMFSDLYSNLNVRLADDAYDRTGYHYLAAGVPLGPSLGAVGAAWSRFFSALYTEDAVLLTYARQAFPDLPLDVGFNLKALEWRVAATETTTGEGALFPALRRAGLTADLGLLFRLGDDGRMGLAVGNLMPADLGLTVAETVATRFRLGAAYRWRLGGPAFESLLTTVEADYGGGVFNPKAGLELLAFQRWLAVRAGINADAVGGGVGLRFPWPGSRVTARLDYALDYRFNVLDTVGAQRLGLTVAWPLTPEPEVRPDPAPPALAPPAPAAAAEAAAPTGTAAAETPGPSPAEVKPGEAPQETADASPAPPAVRSHTPDAKLIVGIEAGVLADFNDIQSVLEKFEALQARLEQETQLVIEKRIFNKPEELAYAFNQGAIDVVVSYSELFRGYQRSRRVTPLLTIRANGSDAQRYCLFVRGDSPIAGLDQLKGRSLGYLNAQDLSRLKAFFRGVPDYSPGRYFSEVKQMNNARDSLVALQLKEVDAIVGFEYFQVVERELGASIGKAMKVVAATDPVPNAPVYVGATLSRAKQAKLARLREILLAYRPAGPDDPLLDHFRIEGFAPIRERR